MLVIFQIFKKISNSIDVDLNFSNFDDLRNLMFHQNQHLSRINENLRIKAC